MKIQLTRTQTHVLLELAAAGRLVLPRLVLAVMRHADLRAASPAEWDTEIRLQIDLLRLYGLVRVVDELGARVCSAPEFVVAWAEANRAAFVREGEGSRPSIILPAVLATVLATAGCGSFSIRAPETAAATPIPLYNAEGTPPPERMEQFYNPRNGSRVYRFCVGSECPVPTPKRPAAPKLPVVTESTLDGGTRPADLLTSAANGGMPAAGAVLNEIPKPVSRPSRETVTPGAGASAAERLGATVARQRHAAERPAAPASQATIDSAGAPQKNAGTPSATDMTPAPAASAPDNTGGQAHTPVQKNAEPTKPQALQESHRGTPQASAPAGGPSQTAETAVASETASSPESFILGWASLWSAKDMEAYFALYAKDFWPTYGSSQSPSAWAGKRRQAMSRPEAIKVTVKTVSITERGDRANIRFWQNYETRGFRSRVLKAVELVKADGKWKIRRERLLPVDPNQVVA